MKILKQCTILSFYVLLSTIFTHAFAKPFKAQHWLTKNGVRVTFYQAMEIPMLDVSLAFTAGSAYDGNFYGLSELTANMINQGNLGQDANTIAESLANYGAQFNINNSKDMTVFSLRSLTKPEALTQSCSIFSQIINHPDFPNESFLREKQHLTMAVKEAQGSPADLANRMFFQTLYKEHPYAHSIYGTLKTIEALKREQVINFYKQYYVAKNAVLVLVGAIDEQKAHQLAEQLTQDMAAGQLASVIPAALQVPHAEQKNINFPSSQTMLRLGQLGIDHHNVNYFPLLVGNYIFGGESLASRLSLRVREKRGLTYGIDSQFLPLCGEGPFLISLATKNSDVSTALKIIQHSLAQFVKDGPSQKELTLAKNYLVGSFPLSLDSNRNIASLLLRISFYHLPDDFLETYVDHIKAVNLNEIKQAFQQQVALDKLVLVRVGQS